MLSPGLRAPSRRLPRPSGRFSRLLRAFTLSFPSLATPNPLSAQISGPAKPGRVLSYRRGGGDDSDCSMAPSAPASPLPLSPAASYPFLRPCFLFPSFPPPLLSLFVPRPPLSLHFLGNFYFWGDFTPKKSKSPPKKVKYRDY